MIFNKNPKTYFGINLDTISKHLMVTYTSKFNNQNNYCL